MSEVMDAPAQADTAESTDSGESLLHAAGDPAASETQEQASTEPEFKFAEKVTVKRADGTVDYEATARKAEQARQHLEKRLGAGDAPPKDITGYKFDIPQDLKDFELKSERLEEFKAEALSKGVTPAQFQWMMGSYLKAVPDLMEGAAKMTAAQAKAELGQVWATPEDFSAGLSAAQSATKALPEDLREMVKEYGTNPTFVRVMAWVGKQLGEDKPMRTTAPAAAQSDINSLMMGEAYRNPRHPDHVRVSQQVNAFFRSREGGDQPI